MIGRLIESTRCNHALEHATVTLLMGRIGPSLRLVGRASSGGFFIYGDVPQDLLEDCANEALQRLKQGESHFAITPLCGTNIATSGIIAALSTLAIVGNGPRRGRTGDALMAGMLGALVAQPVGRMIQRYLTTSPRLETTEIVAIEGTPGSRYHKVRTRRTD